MKYAFTILHKLYLSTSKRFLQRFEIQCRLNFRYYNIQNRSVLASQKKTFTVKVTFSNHILCVDLPQL